MSCGLICDKEWRKWVSAYVETMCIKDIFSWWQKRFVNNYTEIKYLMSVKRFHGRNKNNILCTIKLFDDTNNIITRNIIRSQVQKKYVNNIPTKVFYVRLIDI